MTDLADALAVRKLDPFEGRDVIRAAIEIPNAAGGLREPMKFEPVEMHHGEEGYIVLHYAVTKVRFDPIKDTEALARIHVLNVDDAAFVDGSVVAEHLAQQRARIAEAKARNEALARQQKGEYTIEEEALETEHADGQHASGLRDGCPSCEREKDAAADEAGWGDQDS